MRLRTQPWFMTAVTLGVLTLAPGCHRYLAATPTLLQRPDAQTLFAALPADSQSAETAVLYATDRAVVGSDSQPSYGYGRSAKLAFGVASVRLNPQPSWQELIQDSTRSKRSQE